MAKQLINKNIDLPLSFHIKSLECNKIYIPKIKLKNLLQNIREESFPKDDEFLDRIDFIKIDLGNTLELKNLNFCHVKESFINGQTKKLEKIVIFTTIFQLKLLSESEELFIDGTFKMSPENYCQILNIWGYLKNKNLYVPLIHSLMSSKSYIAYNKVFIHIKNLLTDNNIKVNFNDKTITTDYEKSMRKSIKKILEPKNLNGCFFHYSKALWKKCRNYGLNAKKFRKDSVIFLFCLKYILLFIIIIGTNI